MALPAQTQTRIYNRTLALLGSANRSVSKDDRKPWTDQLNEFWPDAVRDLHAEHPWNHAIRRATLNLKTQTGDGYLYSLPVDCLRWLPPARDSSLYFRGVQEGRYLLCDSDTPPRIRYIALVENIAEWPAHFVTAMGYRLAMDAAEAITQSSGIVEAMRLKYEGDDGDGGALAKAKRADGLSTGDRDRGDVSVHSRTLSAASMSAVGMAPSTRWG